MAAAATTVAVARTINVPIRAAEWLEGAGSSIGRVPRASSARLTRSHEVIMDAQFEQLSNQEPR
ncbi:MAG: hypothetical protein ABSG76_24375 [Xanthobacteraceae bacterium]|jgi:hypothetical protein